MQTWKIRKDSNMENRVFKGHTSNIKAVAFSCKKTLVSVSGKSKFLIQYFLWFNRWGSLFSLTT